MKNFKKLFALAIAVILLAGCGMKENVSFKVTKDKKISLGAKIMMDDEMIDTMLSFGNASYGDDDDFTSGKTFTDADRKEYLEKNICSSQDTEKATCKMITEGKYKGVEITTEPIDIDEFIATEGDEEFDMGGIAEGEFNLNGKLFTKNGDVYSAKLKMSNNSYTGSMDEYSSQIDEFSVVYSISLPNAPISHNADTVSSDGLTLSWNYDLTNLTSAKDIEFSFKFDPNAKPTTNVDPKNNNNNTNNTTTGGDDKASSSKSEGMSTTTLVLIIVCSVLGVALISIIIILLARKSQKNPIQPAPVSSTASQFGNPELANHRDPKEEAPAESDSVSVSEMTNVEETPAEETKATKKDE